MPQLKSKFSENEKLLCYHGPLLYEAKCVKVKKDPNAAASSSSASAAASASASSSSASTSSSSAKEESNSSEGNASSSSSPSSSSSSAQSNSNSNGGGFSYYVHYQGWNKNWDEWVTESRMLKMTPESKIKQKELYEAHVAATKESKKAAKSGKANANSAAAKLKSSNNSRASTPVSDKSEPKDAESSKDKAAGSATSSTSSGPAASKKRKEDNERITKFKISIPEELRYVLANDWDLIVVKKNLFILPAKVSVNGIIDEYLQSINNLPNTKATLNYQVNLEVMRGIKEFFNTLIGTSFLYNIERVQFNALKLKEDQVYADIYGSAHLLRVLSKIDSLLNLTRIEVDPDVALIESIIGEFLKYLEDNMAKYFTSKNYKEAGTDYLKTKSDDASDSSLNESNNASSSTPPASTE